MDGILKNVTSLLQTCKNGDNGRLWTCLEEQIRELSEQPKDRAIQILTSLTKLGRAAEYDLELIRQSDGAQVFMTEDEKVYGLFGSDINMPGDATKGYPKNQPMSTNLDIIPSILQNPELIRSTIKGISTSLDGLFKDVETQIQDYEIKWQQFPSNSTGEFMKMKEMICSTLTKIYEDLMKMRKFERRYQALAYVRLCPKFEFVYLHERFSKFFTSLQRALILMPQTDGALRELFTTALKNAWMIEGGPDHTIRVGGGGKTTIHKAFDIKLSILGLPPSCVTLKSCPDLKVMPEDGEKEGGQKRSERKTECKINFDEHFDHENNSLTITGVMFEKFKGSTSRLSYYERFYVMNLKLMVSVSNTNIDLECKTFPFTVHVNAEQLSAATGSVKWLIFSQNGENFEKTVMRTQLPRHEVLQMFKLQARNITPQCGKDLDKQELMELNRLLYNQNFCLEPNHCENVTMASIFKNNMKHPRNTPAADLDFSLFTWFQAGLNTLSYFEDQWKKGLMLGFYCKEDADSLVSKHDCCRGDVVVRLSQTHVNLPQGITPMTSLTIHLNNGPGEYYIDNFTVKQGDSLFTYLRKFVERDHVDKNRKKYLVKRILPNGGYFHEIFECHLNQPVKIQKSGYCHPSINEDTIEPIQQAFGNLTIQENSPPETLSPQSDACSEPNIPTIVQEMEICRQDTEEKWEEGPVPKKPHLDPQRILMHGTDPMMSEAMPLPEDLANINKTDLISQSLMATVFPRF